MEVVPWKVSLHGGHSGAFCDHARGTLEQVLLGPADAPDGRTNLFGALARTMAKTGYRDLKEFQRVDLVIGGNGESPVGPGHRAG